MAEFLQNLRKSNGFFAVNPELPEGSSGDGFTFTQDQDQDGLVEFNELRLHFESVWKSEYHCPEILPYPTEIIENLKESLHNQQVNY
jgi:hypothetical protein